MLPNFIIPGAQKSGTTALRIYLSQHPNIYMVNKEIHFFDTEENFKKGIEWYKQFFKNNNEKKAIGEKTPEYLYNTKVPERIYNVVPNVKLIFVLRNPVKRAYSHYWHNVRSGQEILNFNKAIFEEEGRNKISKYKNLYSYKDRGKYIIQIKRYAKYFKKSNMFFLLAEDLNRNTVEVLSSILEYLEVETDFKFEDLNKKHVGGIPRSKLLAKLGGNEKIKKFRYLRYLIIGINNKKGYVPKMELDTQKYLYNYFTQYNKELEEFTGLDISTWENEKGK